MVKMETMLLSDLKKQFPADGIKGLLAVVVPTGYGEAGKGFFAVRFRQIASNRDVSDLSAQAKPGSITVTDSWGISPRSTCRIARQRLDSYLISFTLPHDSWFVKWFSLCYCGGDPYVCGRAFPDGTSAHFHAAKAMIRACRPPGFLSANKNGTASKERSRFSVRKAGIAHKCATPKILSAKHGYLCRHGGPFSGRQAGFLTGFTASSHTFSRRLPQWCCWEDAQHYSDPFVRGSHPTSLLSSGPGYAFGLGAT